MDIMNKHIEADALALEYQGEYGSARSNLQFPNFINNAFIKNKSGIFSLSFPEKPCCFLLGDFGSLGGEGEEVEP